MHMIDQPIVSVIVTTYNRSNLIMETISSILAQSMTNFELIIVDDGSTDNTSEVMKNINDNRICYIKTENWGGPARPRNIGIRKAKGKFLAFCDDDDIWVKEKLETQLQHFTKSVVGVGSTTKYINAENKVVSNKTQYVYNKLLDHRAILRAGHGVPMSSLIVRRNNIRFSERRDFIAVEDFDYQIKLLLKTGCRIKQISHPLVAYRIQETNISFNTNNADNVYKVYNLYKDIISAMDLRRIKFKQSYRIGRDLLLKSDYNRSRKYLLFSISNYSYESRNGDKLLKSIAMYLCSYLPLMGNINLFDKFIKKCKY